MWAIAAATINLLAVRMVKDRERRPVMTKAIMVLEIFLEMLLRESLRHLVVDCYHSEGILHTGSKLASAVHFSLRSEICGWRVDTAAHNQETWSPHQTIT
jgi:hypothetical protein